MEEVISGGFAIGLKQPWSRDYVRVVSWNVERGLRFSAILDFLRTAEADLILLQEVDLKARRTQHREVAHELARALQLNYVFGTEFQELSVGSDRSAQHGQATLSPWPLSNGRIIRFERQSNFWTPRWYIPQIELFQRRLGGRIALVTEAMIYNQRLVTYNLHLESKGNDALRLQQLNETLEDAGRHRASSVVIVGGDFNLDAGNGALLRRSTAQDSMTRCGCRRSLLRLGCHSNARVVLIGSTFPMEPVRMGRSTIPFGFQTTIRFRLHCPNKLRPALLFSSERHSHQMYTSLLKSNKSIRTAYAVLALTMTAGIQSAVAEDTPSRLQKGVAVLNKLTDPAGHAIGPEQIGSADCVAVIPGFKKGAAVVGVSYGRGFISCRNGDNWSAPAAVTLEGGSLGVQLGGEKIDIVILSLDKERRSKLLSDRFTIGSDASAAWGNGKSAHADPNAKILFFGRTKGAFAGFDLDGTTLKPDDSGNKALYSKPIKNSEIVEGATTPPVAQPLISKLTSLSSSESATSK